MRHRRQVLVACTLVVLGAGNGLVSAEEEPCPPPGKTGDVQRPILEYEVPAEYTEAAMAAGIEGYVVLQTTIRADGTVTDIEPLKELPMGLTDRAIDAVAQRRFRPATLCGKVVEVYYNQTVQFALPAEAQPPSARRRTSGRSFLSTWTSKAWFIELLGVLLAGTAGAVLGARKLVQAINKAD